MVEKDSEKIYSFGYSFIMFTATLSIFIGKGSYIMFSLTQNDTIIAIILGFILSFITFYIVRYIINKNETNNIYELNENLFGSFLGKALNIIMAIGFYIISLVILYNMADFFNTEYLPETSVDYLKILVLLPLIYLSTKNLSTLIKTNQVFSIVSFIFIVFGFLGTFQELNITNIEPLFLSSKTSIIKSILTYFILFAVPLVMLLVTSKKNIKDSDRLNGNLLKVFIFTNVIFGLIILATILILGREYLSIFRFPEHISLKQFSLFNILERIENILALQYYFNCVGLLSFLYYFLINIMPKTRFRRYYSVLIALSQFIITNVIFKNTITFIEMLKGYFVYSVLIFIFIPLIATYCRLLVKRKNIT